MSNSPEFHYSELPAIELLQTLGYHLMSAAEIKEEMNSTNLLLINRLKAALQRINPDLDELNISKAVDAISSITGSSLMDANQKSWELISRAELTLPQVINGKEEYVGVRYIDYAPENIGLNEFIVVSQMKFTGKARNSVPDLVLYVNGIPLAVIECKSPNTKDAWDNGYNDLIFYQKNSERLFYYNQICAAIWKVGGKYGAINSPQAFYSNYKSKDTTVLNALVGRETTAQDTLLYYLFEPALFLDIIRHFVLFELEEGRVVKKLPRYQQIRSVNKAIEKLQREDKGGVIWHTQGSGKSITMVYLTRKLQAPEYGFNNPTVLIMTDRNDLDTQITGTFRAVGYKNVMQATSVKNLDRLLRNDYGGIITTTIQKFQENEEQAKEEDKISEQEDGNRFKTERHIKDGVLTKVTKSNIDGKWIEIGREEVVLQELSEKENLYVMVDEAHRSQYGFLAAFMRTVMPKAKFIAFTGTPISKDDKSTLAEFYGNDYLDVYTLMESKEDGATVDLLYDQGIALLEVRKKELDEEFDKQFGHLDEDKREKLKREALNKYELSTERITAICKHLVDHYRGKIYPDGHKAMIVCDGREAAVKYQRIMLQLKNEGYHDFESKLIISMGNAKSDEIAADYYEIVDWNKKHPLDLKENIYTDPDAVKQVTDNYKLPFGNENVTEKSGKKKYDNTAFLIVSDMLLTGFDAPIASCMYLDKPLKEHTLLQAIARVNRARNGKLAGYIVDYYGITDYLVQAIEIYGGDVKPDEILKNLSEEIPWLEMHHTKLVEFFKPTGIDRFYERDTYIDKAIQFIEPLDRRDTFKELLKKFNKSIAILLPKVAAMKFKKDFDLFNEIRLQARNTYRDDDGLGISKDESKMLQDLIDAHLIASGVNHLLEEPVSILDKDKFQLELKNASMGTRELKIRNNLKHEIKVGMDRNPAFFKPLADRLEELLKQRETQRITQLDLLKAYEDIQDSIANEKKDSRDHGFFSSMEVAVYSLIKLHYDGQSSSVTRRIFDVVAGELKIVDWEIKSTVQDDMEKKIAVILREKFDRSEAKDKAAVIVNLLIKNKDA
ncbi:type I restriction endonuclease subunit R [Chitinophaga flava]|uniref:type I site-specific deoxyribonuclease n=1 Tax=Chitinophaga flava TaxID=2259036 RepID=A0A365XU82_9BACT|nr:type I restriction endonuclease [Chitinophaga flava]RBL89145.1 type I restriction endonuclease subunit R [Chitinophaga flava]